MQSPASTDCGRPCPACDNSSAAPLFHQHFCTVDDHPIKNGYDIVTCKSCGMVFADQLPIQETLDDYYREFSKYADSASATGSGVEAWDDARLGETADFLADQILHRHDHVLDLGCASGGLLRHLAARGFSRLSGVDPSLGCISAIQTWASAAGVRVSALQGSAFSIPAQIENADIVILSHVLEHVRDVKKLLTCIRSRMSAGGRLYVEVPNALQYDTFLAAPYLEFNTEHVNHFSVGHLSLALSSAGFAPAQSGEKVCQSSASTWYPCAWVLAEAIDVPALPTVQTDALAQAIDRYVRDSQQMLVSFAQHVLRECVDIDELIVWGTGQTASILLARHPFTTLRIRCYCDTNTRFAGRTIRGAPVLRPEELIALPQFPILVASRLYAQSIEASIRAHGLANRLVFLEGGA